MNRADNITAALRTLDPADQNVESTGGRARADLHAIVAQDPTLLLRAEAGSPVRADHRPRRAGRTAGRAALLGGLSVAVAAVLVVLPSLAGGDSAFATWTADPAGLSAQQRVAAADDCRDKQQGGPGKDFGDALSNAEPVIAERRGVWTTVVLAGRGGFSAMCITDDSAGLFDDAMIGSIGTPTGYVALGPRELFATDLGTGIMGAGDISLAAGAVGPDVVGVAYRSRDRGVVSATVGGAVSRSGFPVTS